MCFGVCFYLSTSNDQVFFFIYATTRFSLQKKNINKSKLSQLTRIFSFSKERKRLGKIFFLAERKTSLIQTLLDSKGSCVNTWITNKKTFEYIKCAH